MLTGVLVLVLGLFFLAVGLFAYFRNLRGKEPVVAETGQRLRGEL